jgi:hypothetical protein
LEGGDVKGVVAHDVNGDVLLLRDVGHLWCQIGLTERYLHQLELQALGAEERS